ncbi:UNVERIFIED_CONTAM: Retrovirus-related Pol polyprotein from transposon TNT 1-94 [Sesamum radiatum]|uniref:Retrovirus-related Pol polyprotein from transposon TNT 1-94 n=1 Tax=Sesamum radiatum TaxID=300843 RepID=A0AAW2M1D8_SESRA
MIQSMMSFNELPLFFWDSALETAARLLNIASSKRVAQTPYQIWYGKPASYKYLRVWGSPAYVKRIVADKLDSRSSLCRFIGYPKETAGYYFYDPTEQKVFFSRNAVFLERGFPIDTRRDELLLEESSEAPQSNAGTSSAPDVSTNNVPILRRSARVSQFLKGMVYKRKIGADGEVTNFKARLVAKGYTQRLGLDFEETFSPVAMAKSIRIRLAIAAWYDYEIWQMDVKMAFLDGFIEEEIYIDQPEGFTVVGEERKISGVCRRSALEGVLKYLRRTKDVFLVYGGGELILEGFRDASFQSDDDDAKSQSGFVFKLNGGVVAWKSSKQDTTVDSTMEAEYIAASEAAKEAVWMKNYIQELGVVPNIAEPVVIFCDNNRAIAQAKEPRSHHRSKHILKRYHMFREMVGRGDVRMDRVSSLENTTDLLIKPVSQISHAQHLGKMGLRQMSDWL